MDKMMCDMLIFFISVMLLSFKLLPSYERIVICNGSHYDSDNKKCIERGAKSRLFCEELEYARLDIMVQM